MGETTMTKPERTRAFRSLAVLRMTEMRETLEKLAYGRVQEVQDALRVFEVADLRDVLEDWALGRDLWGMGDRLHERSNAEIEQAVAWAFQQDLGVAVDQARQWYHTFYHGCDCPA